MPGESRNVEPSGGVMAFGIVGVVIAIIAFLVWLIVLIAAIKVLRSKNL